MILGGIVAFAVMHFAGPAIGGWLFSLGITGTASTIALQGVSFGISKAVGGAVGLLGRTPAAKPIPLLVIKNQQLERVPGQTTRFL